ncbi:pirin family protein [Algoriphagus lacus]|uniref:Pirin family protein n=1 Tax=Algoriphagus lacus TaxID=2056311 RepID=A0A418PNI8_9BACT|nr:pirin family protein [Algoriphagus lacus]RIW13397.1 pirin family protein [Algoriphagus lacus]
MKTNLIRRQDRQISTKDWRIAWHEYFPGRTRFGQLTGFNFDVVSPGQGFPMHSHRDMEIITIPTEGEQFHKDSLGNSQIIGLGMIQLMSAGSGIYHSEMNASDLFPFKSYQIWIYPNEKNLSPSYQQKQYDPLRTGIQLLVSPNAEADSLRIHQSAWLYYANFSQNSPVTFTPRTDTQSVYIQVIKGNISVNGIEKIQTEDSIEIEPDQPFQIYFAEDSQLILIES